MSAMMNIEALEIVGKINLLHQQTRDQIARVEAQMMESLWELRRAFEDDEQFEQCVAVRITWLKPDEAVKRVSTWDVARKNRELREMAQSNPTKAMQFVGKLLTDDGGIVADDAEVVRLLTMRPRQRDKEIKRLQQVDTDVKAGNRAEHNEELKTMKAERDKALEALEKTNKVTNINDAPAARLAKFAEACDTNAQQMRDIVAGLEGYLADTADVDDAIIGTYQEQLTSWQQEVTQLSAAIANEWLVRVREIV